MVKPDKGTTSFGFLFKEGIIVASYSPLSTGTPQIMEINRYMLSTTVSRGADQLLLDKCMEYESQNNRRMSAQLASEHLEIILSSCSDATSALIASWEPQMGPLLYLVDNCEEGCLPCSRFWLRSGSVFVHDSSEIRKRYNMSLCEAASFARWAIHLAAFEDGVRDGVASVYYVGRNGWKKMFSDDVVKRCHCYPITPNTVDQETKDEEAGGQEMAEAPRE